jgi:hypothetical protein
MRRRPFLHLTAGAIASAGCVGTADVPVDSATETAASSDTRVARDAGTEMAVSDDAPLSLEAVESADYVVRLNDLGEDPGGTVTEFSDLTDREQGVVETAIESGYETDDPPEWVLQFASATPVVRHEGAYYRLEDTFPTYEVTAQAIAGTDADGPIATYDEYETAVTRDGYVMSGLLRVARREGVELSYVWPALRTFFDDYAAVRYRGDVVAFSVAVADAGPPYEISGTEVPVAEAVEGSVWNANEAAEDAREIVRRAGRTQGAYGFDRAPEGFLETLRSHKYVHFDGTFYTTYVEKDESVPLAASASFADGRLELAVRNEADAERQLRTGPPRPFGVVRCHPAGASETTHLLWTDAYAESSRVQTDRREVELVDDIGIDVALEPGESANETYEVPADLSPGEYVVPLSLGVARGGEDSVTVQYRVVFSVTAQETTSR